MKDQSGLTTVELLLIVIVVLLIIAIFAGGISVSD
jgi:Tfp pilus assembly protein FimT